MLKELLETILGLQRRAEALEVKTIQGVPRVAWLRHGEYLETIPLPAPDRSPVVNGLSDLVQMLALKEIAPKPEAYVGPAGVVVFLDSDERIGRVSMPLPCTNRYLALARLIENPSLSIPEAIRLLRFELYGPHSAGLISALRNVDFTRNSGAKRTTDHGRESLGRSVEAAVQGIEKIPEEFRVRIPAWNVSGLRSIEIDVTIGIYIQTDSERLELRPLRDELDLAIAMALAAVQAAIQQALPALPVFLGTP